MMLPKFIEDLNFIVEPFLIWCLIGLIVEMLSLLITDGDISLIDDSLLKFRLDYFRLSIIFSSVIEVVGM